MKTLLYPYKADFEYYLDAIKLFRKDLEVVGVYIPKAFEKYTSVPIRVKNYCSFNDALPHVDCVVFLPMESTSTLLEKASIALQNKKKIVISTLISEEEYIFLNKLANDYQSEIEYKENKSLMDFLRRRADIFTQQESIILGVAALTQGLNTNKTVIELYKELSERGYSVGIIGSSTELRGLCIEELPLDEMITSDLDDTIMQINRFVNFFEVKNRPNIIILQLPSEGFYRISSNFNTCYGAKTYLISQAVAIDYCIIETPYMEFSAEVFDQLSEISEKRYGFNYNAICFNHKIVDMQGMEGERTVRYCLSEPSSIEKIVARLQSEDQSGRLYVDASKNWYGYVVDDIIDQLSQ